ncbi:DUF4124 domain-containing protein [Niveibacterium sp. SC-1]|uniref:DUF4124 domain-containing protein n=1 Tax=Niveibacterium sp. SC-1 TaxID=3135646 RepID=UPI00311F9723
MKAWRSLLLLCIALSFGAAQAQVYKWQDEKGRTIYGDTPPSGVKASPVEAPITVIHDDNAPPLAPTAPEAPAAQRAPEAPRAPAAYSSPNSADQERAAKRERMIARCKADRGVDCEDEVDALLDGPANLAYPDEYPYWVHTRPPRPLPPPRPPKPPVKPKPPTGKPGTGIAKDL